GNARVRIDSGVVEGSEISLFYDPMIAKLCTWAPDRAGAVDAMADALDGFSLGGIRHNIPFLAALMAHPRWRDGRLSTAFIGEEFPGGFAGVPPSDADRAVLAAVAASMELAAMRTPAGVAGGQGAAGGRWIVMLDRDPHPVTLVSRDGDAVDLDFGGRVR